VWPSVNERFTLRGRLFAPEQGKMIFSFLRAPERGLFAVFEPSYEIQSKVLQFF
jgi:hypothetical protein